MNQITALLISIAVESPCSAFTLYCMGKKDYTRAACIAAGSTLLSHPFAWAANTFWLSHWPFWQRSLVIESFVIIFEAVFYLWFLRLSVVQSLGISFIANALSFGAGLFIWLIERG